METLDLETFGVDEMNVIQLSEIDGGSWLSDKICYIAGMMFMTPGKMAVDGYAAQTHSY